jgi:hypothetical protein
MTVRAMISQVREIIKERYGDTRLSNKFTYSNLLKMAKILLKRESDNFKLLKYQTLYQSLKCVEVIEAPSIDPCCGLKSYCSIWRTKDKLPELFEDSMGVLIMSVTSVDGSTEYDFKTVESIRRKMSNPWVKKYEDPTYCFFKDDYLYFTKRTLLVEIKGMFTRSIEKYNKCGGDIPCIKFLDEKFYIPGYLEEPLIKMTLEELTKIYKALPEDQSVNKNNNT